jgi:hypothetical protein
MSTTAILLSMTIMFMDTETLKISKGPVVRETFTAAREAECSARLNQLMNSGGPGRMFGGFQPHPDGSMVPCQPVAEEKVPISEVYLLSATLMYFTKSDRQYVKDRVIRESFPLNRFDQCVSRVRQLTNSGAGTKGNIANMVAHPDGSMAICKRTTIR